MKKNKEIEDLLLNDSNYEELVKAKIEKEFNENLNSAAIKDEYIFDIKKVPSDKLFSKDAIYEVINKSSKTKSYINGLQAEGYIGAQNEARIKLLNGVSDSFISSDCYIKFVKVKI